MAPRDGDEGKLQEKLSPWEQHGQAVQTFSSILVHGSPGETCPY